MTPQIDAAITELLLYQDDLEKLLDLINDPGTNGGLTEVLTLCCRFRMHFLKTNIKALENYIAKQLDQQTLTLEP